MTVVLEEPTVAEGESIPLPSQVAVRLAQFQEQIEALQQAQRQYAVGVVDALGLEGTIKIDLATMTYRLGGQ